MSSTAPDKEIDIVKIHWLYHLMRIPVVAPFVLSVTHAVNQKGNFVLEAMLTGNPPRDVINEAGKPYVSQFGTYKTRVIY